MSDLGRSWLALTEVVRGDDRRKQVSDALGGMSYVRVKALRYLLQGPKTGRELATKLATDPPFVSVIVDDLEERGYVDRKPHPDDRRRKLIELTPEGVKAAKRAEQILSEPPPALRSLPAEDLDAFQRIVAALLADHH
jgi:DNA-binding MarR family transcriptional regulator